MSGLTETGQFPAVIFNPPGLSAIGYRVGDYTSFREALLRNLPGEVELKGWRPTADGDLTLQLLEWWAYIADVLTFYNERIANNAYLGTAVLPADVQPQTGVSTPTPTPAGLPDNASLIAQVVGFKPSPGLAATGQLAVLVNGQTPIALPPLFAVQSKPGPGQAPQVFEAVASANSYLPTDAGGAVPVDLSCDTVFTATGVATVNAVLPPRNGPLLKGAITSIKPGDRVVVAQSGTAFSHAFSFTVVVQTVTAEQDPRGRTNTRLGFAPVALPPAFTPTSPDVTACQVLRSIQSTGTYAFHSANGVAPVVTGLTPETASRSLGIHLASLVRDIAVGDLVVMEVVPLFGPAPGTGNFVTAAVAAYQETVWYANATDPVREPQRPPDTPRNVVPIPIPHTFLTLEPNVLEDSVRRGQTVTRVWYAYRPVSVPLDEMPAASLAAASSIANFNVRPAGVVNGQAQAGMPLLLEGADGLGATATLLEPPGQAQPLRLKSTGSAPIALPMRVLFNVFAVTAGKTVVNEVLGNGDATVASQSFTLQKSPLTYLHAADAGSPISTLRVFVDNVEWTEVPNFQAQPPDAKVFVTRRDKDQNTTVIFGDGVNGARLTTGAGNATATYRYGSGPGDPRLGGPAAGTVVTVLTPYPGLGSIRNPVPMTGGAAPGTPQQVQANAPDTVLSFGRTISSVDYAAAAARVPSVTRARAQTGWDAQTSRNAVFVYVSGGPDAVAATQAALRKIADPNRPVVVRRATEIDLLIALVVSYDPSVDPSTVQSGIVAALTDPVAGVFAPSAIGIGDALFDSSIYAACHQVAGVVAVRGLTIRTITGMAAADYANAPILAGAVHPSGAGGYFALAANAVIINLEAAHG